MGESEMANILFSHVAATALVVHLIQLLKKYPKFGILQERGTVLAKRLFSIGGALLANAGISFVWSWHAAALVATPGSHVFSISFTIPPLLVILTGLWHWFGQFAFQEGWYQGTYNLSEKLKTISTVLAAIQETKGTKP